MEAGKLAIRPWLVCQYNENTLVDLPSSVVPLIEIGLTDQPKPGGTSPPGTTPLNNAKVFTILFSNIRHNYNTDYNFNNRLQSQ